MRVMVCMDFHDSAGQRGSGMLCRRMDMAVPPQIGDEVNVLAGSSDEDAEWPVPVRRRIVYPDRVEVHCYQSDLPGTLDDEEVAELRAAGFGTPGEALAA